MIRAFIFDLDGHPQFRRDILGRSPGKLRNIAHSGDALGRIRGHHTCGEKGYRRGRTMNDRTDEIRSTRAPTLGEDQIEILRRYGQTRETEVGQVLF